MRKFILAFFMFCVSMSLQAQSDCIIRGTAGESLAGKMVYLYQLENGKEVAKRLIDSTKIVHGTFSFQRVQPQKRYALIRVQQQEEDIPLILETGIICVSADSCTVGGTPTNDKLNAAMQYIKPVKNEMVALSKQLSVAGKSQEELMAKLKELQQPLHDAAVKYVATIKQSISQNADNLSSAYLFLQAGMFLVPDEADRIWAEITPEYTKHPFVKLVMMQIEKKRVGENIKIGNRFMEAQLKDSTDREITLSTFVGKGKYVLIDFWASWCAPCRREMPFVKAVYAKYASKGFDVIGVSVDEKKEDWMKAIQSLGLNWPQVLDVTASKVYGIKSIPFTLLIAPDGTIVDRGLRGEMLKKRLEELLGE